jgi:hypothetical protein
VTVEGTATVLAVAELQALPQKTVTVHNERTKTDESYSGLPLGDLLAKYGFPVDRTTHRKMLRSYVVATGMDQYWVLSSATEMEGSEHSGDVIVAVATEMASRWGKTGCSSCCERGQEIVAVGQKSDCHCFEERGVAY